MKSTVISIIIAIALVGGAFLLAQTNFSDKSGAPINSVSVVDGKQIIEIRARGGYQPRKSVAKSGLPTILRFSTNGTFDCSASVRIPSMGISKLLQSSGSFDINLGTSTSGILRGSCGMGMYPFEIEFQD
ncbi:MAG: hypothetical protein AAB470_01855 [Patescibacteria group bacterium]